jgi:hypothetical protein
MNNVMQVWKLMAVKVEQWSRHRNSALNVKYKLVSFLCVLHRVEMFLEDLSTIVLLYLVFMCCAGYVR